MNRFPTLAALAFAMMTSPAWAVSPAPQAVITKSPSRLHATTRTHDTKPNTAIQAKPRFKNAKWRQRQASLVSAAQNTQADVLFLGDSITEGWRFTSSWARHFKFSAFNAGIESDRTQHVLWRLKQGLVKQIQPKLAVILVGTNNTLINTPEEITEGIAAIATEVKTQKQDTQILILAILPSGHQPNAQRRVANERANQLIAAYAQQSGHQFLDVSHLFLDPNGVITKDIMPDFLHPSSKAYERWAQAMSPVITSILKKSAL